MERANSRKRTALIVAVSIFIVIAVVVAAIPLFILFRQGSGVKTQPVDHAKVSPASTGLDGRWEVTKRPGANFTSAGFTFNEVLPGERRSTSASTQGVTGYAVIEAGTLTAGEITVDMTHLTSDSDVRDENVRRRILNTDQFPEATFVVTEPVDLSGVPDNGTVGLVQLRGDMTIRGETRNVVGDFEVARSADRLVVGGTIPINREEFGVKSPELVAAKIAEDGEVNVRLNMVQ